MPYFFASSLPRSSAVTMVICDRLMSIWRRISGSTPWPIEPKPIITMRPLKPAGFTCLAMESPPYNEHRRGQAPPALSTGIAEALDADRLQRREAVEIDGRIARGVGAGGEDFHLVADFEV